MSEREHVNEKDFVKDTNNDRKGRVIEVRAAHGQARIHWTDNSETWVDLNTLCKLSPQGAKRGSSFTQEQIESVYGTTAPTKAFAMGWHRSHMRNSKNENGGICAQSRRQLKKAIKTKAESEFSIGWVLQEFFSLLTGTNPSLPTAKKDDPEPGAKLALG